MEGGAGSLSGLTMAALLGKEKDRQQSVNHRTLLDIIRQEEPNCRAYENLIDRQESKKGWSFFKDRRLRAKRIMDDDLRHVGVPAAASDVGFCRDLVSTSNGMVVGAGSENSQRPALAQLLRDSSVRVVEQVREDSESGEVPLEVTGQAQSQLINEQVLEDDDSGEVPWAVTGEGQSLSQYLSRVGSSRQSDVDHEDSLGIDHVTVSDVPVPALNSLSSMLTRNLLQIRSAEQSDEPVRSVRLSEALAAEREHMHVAVSTTEADGSGQNEVAEINHSDGERAEAANEQQQVRISLMELLEETDSRQNGWSSYTADVEDCTGVSNENIEEEGSNFVNQNCCVCMVRHKGSAFIPCGHTFCRQCSRELWVKRGNCPICNGFILEILDIF